MLWKPNHKFSIMVKMHVVCLVFLYSGLSANHNDFILQDTIIITDGIPYISIANTTNKVLVVDSIRLISPLDSVDMGDTATLKLGGEGKGFRYNLIENDTVQNNLLSVPSDSILKLWPFPNLPFWDTKVVLTFHSQDLVDTLVIVLQPGLNVHNKKHLLYNEKINSPGLLFNPLGQRMPIENNHGAFQLYIGTMGNGYNTIIRSYYKKEVNK